MRRFVETDQRDLPCPVPPFKNIPLSPSGKSSLQACPIPSPQEGRIMIVTDVGQGMRWTRRCWARASAQTNGTFAYGEVVWSRRPDAGVKFFEKQTLLRSDGDKKARSPRRARYKP